VNFTTVVAFISCVTFAGDNDACWRTAISQWPERTKVRSTAHQCNKGSVATPDIVIPRMSIRGVEVKPLASFSVALERDSRSGAFVPVNKLWGRVG
jgi:hypothetical protein